ncbi:CrcB family protein [Lentilactobacillus senioris]|uniref:CrcB family protein n=1 Tax=Lentilactobacillus senioris TaxID=931534 RepID=UPI000AFEFEAA|nr:CrcB family protein [Lentilactobacillus senioris]
MGGFTTFSTFMNEAAMLINARSWGGRLLAYLVISYVGGAGVCCGWGGYRFR